MYRINVCDTTVIGKHMATAVWRSEYADLGDADHAALMLALEIRDILERIHEEVFDLTEDFRNVNHPSLGETRWLIRGDTIVELLWLDDCSD